MDSRFIFCGALPPPVHGQGLINERIVKAIVNINSSAAIAIYDISPDIKRGVLLYHFSRFWRTLRSIWAVLSGKANSDATLYLVYEAGLGIVYNYAFAIACRPKVGRVFLHHHSSEHTKKKSLRAAILFKLLGRHTTHVLLSQAMTEDFKRLYGSLYTSILSSNAIHIPAPERGSLKGRDHSRPFAIGMLSNLTVEKGVLEVVALFEHLIASGAVCRLELAGPIVDRESRAAIRRVEGKHGALVRHWGFVTGDRKTEFLSGLDVFIFATHYRYEAQPLVILEALAHGLPVVSTSQGYIPEMIPDNAWKISNDENFIERAAPVLETLMKDAEAYRSARELARVAYESQRAQSALEFNQLMQAVCDTRFPKAK